VLHKEEYCRFKAQAIALHLIERERMIKLLAANEQKNTISNDSIDSSDSGSSLESDRSDASGSSSGES
jgi:hypothetical protein